MTVILYIFVCFLIIGQTLQQIPLVINTWAFTNSTKRAWEALTKDGMTAIDALVEGCSVCEREQCDGTVGYGGSPDENGETTLDAMIMDGNTMNIGAVGALRNIKDAIAVARKVLENTRHTMLVGDQATEFALQMGFRKETLSTAKSKSIWKSWKENRCQPNFWTNVIPKPTMSCGPYEPVSLNSIEELNWNYAFGRFNHDTIGMIVIDSDGKVVAGTSTNGARHKIPGRIGDSPIPGAGAYADSNVGAATATGDGDIMMRFLPSLLAVEDMRRGVKPHEAGENAIKRIAHFYPNFMGGIVVAKKDGSYGAACYGIPEFPFSVYNTLTNQVIVDKVKCFVEEIAIHF